MNVKSFKVIVTNPTTKEMPDHMVDVRDLAASMTSDNVAWLLIYIIHGKTVDPHMVGRALRAFAHESVLHKILVFCAGLVCGMNIIE